MTTADVIRSNHMFTTMWLDVFLTWLKVSYRYKASIIVNITQENRIQKRIRE